MSRELDTAYALLLSVQTLERLALEEVQQTERGVLFVPTPQPPRVGSRVQIDVTTAGEPEATRLAAMVVWSRPGRPGIVAGFRGQITEAPAELLEHIRDLASAARMKIERREAEERRSSLDSPITERIRRREVTAPTRSETPLTGKVAVSREVTAPQQASGAWPASSPPNPESTGRQRTAPPVRITFTSARTYLLHFQQFLSKGQVYVHTLPVPASGTPVSITLEVPDGEPPLVVNAQVERAAQPPEVPQPGWIARFIDGDGTIGERLATATFIATSPSAPPPKRS